MLSRVCTSCVRSARQIACPTVVLPIRPAPRAFTVAAPVYKKASKQVQEQFEEDFVEDEFDDEDLAAPAAPPPKDGPSRDARYAQALSDVQSALRAAKQHDGRSRTPSLKLLYHLVGSSQPSQLPEVLSAVAKWRAANLPALPDRVASLLVKRLSQLEADEGQAAVEVLLNRDLYGVDVPNDLRALYPLLAKVSRPHALAAVEAGEAGGAGEAGEAGAPAAAPAVVEHAHKDAYRFVDANPADIAFALHGLATQYMPMASQDVLVGLTTLAAALRSGETTSARVTELVQGLVRIGEEALMEQAQGLPKRWKEIVRMRARVVAEKMREDGHAEVEWFAHLAESLHVAARK